GALACARSRRRGARGRAGRGVRDTARSAGRQDVAGDRAARPARRARLRAAAARRRPGGGRAAGPDARRPGTAAAAAPPRARPRGLAFGRPRQAGGRVAPPPRARTLADLAPLLRRPLPEGDPLLPYADVVTDPAYAAQRLRGYLTGSVDVVLRTDDRYLVVD